MSMGIYLITVNTNTGPKLYVGQSQSIEERWKKHCSRYTELNGRESEKPLYRAMRKYGADSFNLTILEECSKSELNDRETFWIKYYNTTDPAIGYNLTFGGESGHSNKLTLENVMEIQRLLSQTNRTAHQIAIDFQVSDNTISSINLGLSWINDELSYPIRDHQANEKSLHKCIDCNIELQDAKTIRCRTCHTIFQQRHKPTKELLLEQIATLGFSATGRIYSVSHTTIRRWAAACGLPSLINDVKTLWRTQNNIEVVQPTKSKKTEVLQICLATNQIINRFPSGRSAAIALGSEGYRNSINKACKAHRGVAHGFVWERIEKA